MRPNWTRTSDLSLTPLDEAVMTAPARFRQADLARALNAAKRCGFEQVRVLIGVDGGLEVIVGSAANDPDPVELD
jgi:hypothetical protein